MGIGVPVGVTVGIAVAVTGIGVDGTTVPSGNTVGWTVPCIPSAETDAGTLGAYVGATVGAYVGAAVGTKVGAIVGIIVGASVVGAFVPGTMEGCRVTGIGVVVAIIGLPVAGTVDCTG